MTNKHKVVFLSLLAGLMMAPQANAQILPDNDLYLEDNINKSSAIDEKGFNRLIDEVVVHFGPIVKGHGGRLVVNRKWTDSTVNASAQQTAGSWILNMYGGLARRNEISPDGFQMVVCHELGHHLGGFPFVTSWAADEGEADYFATMVCARKIWKTQQAINQRFRAAVDPFTKQNCDNAHKLNADRDLCYRATLAGQSLANLLAALGTQKMPALDTPDARVVQATNHAHPKAQCRLDTYFLGALCAAKWQDNVIPGRKHPNGQESVGAERDASIVSCMKATGFGMGLRPSCWFKARM